MVTMKTPLLDHQKRHRSKVLVFLTVVMAISFISLAVYFCVARAPVAPLATLVYPCWCFKAHYPYDHVVACKSDTEWDDLILSWNIDCRLRDNSSFAVFACPEGTLSLNTTALTCANPWDTRCLGLSIAGGITFTLGILGIFYS